MAVKKKRSPAKIRASKKLVELNKKRRKKNPAKKKKAVSRKMRTGKRRTVKEQTRYKKRVAKKKVKGYYPNPGFFVIQAKGKVKQNKDLVGYFTGKMMFDDNVKKAALYQGRSQAQEISSLLKGNFGASWNIKVIPYPK